MQPQACFPQTFYIMESSEVPTMERPRIHTWPTQTEPHYYPHNVAYIAYNQPSPSYYPCVPSPTCSSGYPSTSDLSSYSYCTASSYRGSPYGLSVSTPRLPVISDVRPHENSQNFQTRTPTATTAVPTPEVELLPPRSHSADAAVVPKPARKRIRKTEPSKKKMNEWGKESYAELIEMALNSSPNGRMKLHHIYEWFIDHIPYFRTISTAVPPIEGWKNSIRHNLSLHSRFTRIQNEGAGKSSWWVINPDAKAGRNPRRRAVTMDSNKADLKTAAKRAGKRGNKGQRGAVGNSVSGSTVSVNDIRFNEDDALNTAFDNFRPRTQSNVSVGASGRISPLGHGFDEFDFPPYSRTGALGEAANSNADMNDILGKTDSIRIDSGYRSPPQGNSNAHLNGMKMEVVDRPPSYSELNPVRSNMSGPMQQNMIRSPFNGQQQSLRGMPLGNVTMPNNTNNYYPMYMNNGMLPSQSTSMQQPAVSWSQNPMDPYMNMGPQPTQQQMGPSIFDTPSNQNLPNDLDSLTIVPDPALMEYDMDALMRHEMEQQNTSHLQFDL